MTTFRDIMREEEEEKMKAATVVKTEAKAEEAEAWHVPHDIVRDILLRLPAKSLLRFKAVHSSWYSLISDSQFVKSHVDLANKGQNGNLQNFGVIRMLPESVCFASINSGVTDCKEVELSYVYPRIHLYGVDIFGSCNGLLLIGALCSASGYVCSADAYYFLWNPSTGECKKLPSRNFYYDVYISGLSYDSLLDEYKAVIAINQRYRCLSSSDGDLMYDLLKSGFSAWERTYSNFGDHSSMYECTTSLFGLTLNGAPHWMVHSSRQDYHSAKRMIIYFDVAEETFKKVPNPELENTKFDLAVLGGCLCIVHNQEGNHVDIWVMKEYGVKESWTKVFMIELTVERLMPLGFINNGDELVMVINGMKLVIYNLKTKKEKFVTLIRDNFGLNVAEFVECSVVAYVESLVWPELDCQSSHYDSDASPVEDSDDEEDDWKIEEEDWKMEEALVNDLNMKLKRKGRSHVRR